MSIYYKINDDNNLICDTRKTDILIDSRNHINTSQTSVKSSIQHFDNLKVNIEPLYNVVRMELIYYYLRFFDTETGYANPYVNLYLSDYGRIVNNYDGTKTTYVEDFLGSLDPPIPNKPIMQKPFAILPLETSIIYPTNYHSTKAPYTTNTNKMNYEVFPSDKNVGYEAKNFIPHNFKIVTDYSTPIDRITRFDISLRDFQGNLLSEQTRTRAASDDDMNYLVLMLQITSKV